MARILVVDDEDDVRDSVAEILEDADQQVLQASNGFEALDLLQREQIDLIVLDVIMPEMDGYEVCRKVRANPATFRIPILFLTARSRVSDIATGLDYGGDDYLTKPYDVIELPARVRALLRRAPGNSLNPQEDFIDYRDLRLNLNFPEVSFGSDVLSLTPTEYRLLHYLINHAGQPCSTDILLQDLWDYPPGVGDPQLVRVHVNNLRTKLEDMGCTYLQNQHGRGYLLM